MIRSTRTCRRRSSPKVCLPLGFPFASALFAPRWNSYSRKSSPYLRHGGVCIEQFVSVFVRISCGRRCAAEVNRVLVAGHDGVDWRILPRPQTFKAELVFVIADRSGNVGGEELRCD